MSDAKQPASSSFGKIATIIVVLVMLALIGSVVYGFIRGFTQRPVPMVPNGRPGDM